MACHPYIDPDRGIPIAASHDHGPWQPCALDLALLHRDHPNAGPVPRSPDAVPAPEHDDIPPGTTPAAQP